MRLPDFLIIGAMKCGTTTLQVQLANQPGVFMTTPKEPNFFSDDHVYANGLDWYQALFDPAELGDLKGEASTHYTKLPHFPDTLDRMAQVLKAPKLIYMIRNPVERAVSHYIHDWSRRAIGHTVDTAFDYHHDLIEYGLYGMQIEPFVEAYGVDSIFLTSLEQLTASPQNELAKICTFIGHEMPARWDHSLDAQNVSSNRARPLPMQRILVDNPAAEALRRTFVPKSLREWVLNSRKMSERPTLNQETRERLEGVFLSDREHLALRFPDHAALRICYPFAA